MNNEIFQDAALAVRCQIGEQDAWAALIEEGVYTNPVIPPAAPPNQSLLRTSYTATQGDLENIYIFAAISRGRAVGSSSGS